MAEMSNTQILFEIAKLVVSILGFGGTIYALSFGFRQYTRNEQWKKAEFVAKEIKEFESDALVRNAMQMIDWGERRINLFLEKDLKYDQFTLINREDQWRALLPHTIKIHYPSRHLAKDIEQKKRFTPEEVLVRDTYDAFLGYLQRFGNFIEAGLVSSGDMKPYLNYWLTSIAKGDSEKDIDSIDDLLWRYTLLSYINFYNYKTVIELFNQFKFDISPEGGILEDLKIKLNNKKLYGKQTEDEAVDFVINQDAFERNKLLIELLEIRIKP